MSTESNVMRCALVGLVGLAIAGCGGGGSGGSGDNGGSTPPPPPPVSISFTADKTSLVAGDSATLTWSSSQASSCSASASWSGSKKALTGSQSTGALNNSRRFHLHAYVQRQRRKHIAVTDAERCVGGVNLGPEKLGQRELELGSTYEI